MGLSYTINNFIKLKLESGETKIFVNEKEFMICKHAILNIPKTNVSETSSIDDLLENLEVLKDFKIDSKSIFWAHCSNLQAWVEFNYNLDFLDSRLGLPLLKRLFELGDLKAMQVFKEEIAKKYGFGPYKIQEFLKVEGYLTYLSMEELINGALKIEESSILFDIFDIMKKQLGINFRLALSLDEDKVRHRLNPFSRYFSIAKGHIYELEFDLFPESSELFNKLSQFKNLEWLVLYLNKSKVVDFSKFKFESLKILKIHIVSVAVINDNFDAFPNLAYLGIYNNSRKKNCINGLSSLINLHNLKEIRLYNSNIHFNELIYLSKKGVKIYINNKLFENF